jgi:hypothetical protein
MLPGDPRSRPPGRGQVGGWDDAEVDRAPICAHCGVTALPADSAHVVDTRFVCENPDCITFGEEVGAS